MARSSGTRRPFATATSYGRAFIGDGLHAASKGSTMAEDPAAPPTFEEAVADLERVVRTLEDGTTGLDDALQAYERGVGLLRACYQHLRQAEQRILQLSGTDADGRPTLELFDHASAVAPERSDGRRRKTA